MSFLFGGPGFPVVEKVLATSERRGLLAQGDVVVVGVSGGPDSACLLDVLARLSARLELTLHVAHVDHGLQPGSDEVTARVASSGAAAGFDVHVVRAPGLEGPNLHARARAFRYGFFDIVAEQTGAARIATGHTLDDRAETTIARLLHGAPPQVLAGIRYADGNRIHPLLDVRRAEARTYCDERGLDWVDDPANDDLRFERAAVRRLLVAPIEERWGDGAIRAIAVAAQRLGEDADALDGIADRLYADMAQEGRAAAFPRDAFGALPRGLRRRLLERAVGRVRDRHGGIDAALDGLEEAGHESGARFAVAGGGEIVIERDAVKVESAATREPRSEGK